MVRSRSADPHRPPAPDWYKSRGQERAVLEKQIDLSYASLALPKQLKDLRAGAGLSQAEVAERAGISAAHLSRIESGKIKNLEIRTVLRLAAVCGATVLVTFVDNLPHR